MHFVLMEGPHTLSTSASPSLDQALAAMIEAKKKSGRRPAYLSTLKFHLEPFARAHPTKSICQITLADVQAWVDQAKTTHSRATRLNRLSTLFAFAVRQGWVPANPALRIERVAIDRRPPKILSPNQCAAIMANVPPRSRPWFSLCLLCGLRPDEARRLMWDHIRIAERHVVVDAAASKVRRRRIVPMDDIAAAWLAIDAQPTGPVVTSYTNLRRDRRAAAAAAGIRWTADVLRHTHASMRLARGDAADKVSADMGNSTGILLTHYKELATADTAAKFWALRP